MGSITTTTSLKFLGRLKWCYVIEVKTCEKAISCADCQNNIQNSNVESLSGWKRLLLKLVFRINVLMLLHTWTDINQSKFKKCRTCIIFKQNPRLQLFRRKLPLTGKCFLWKIFSGKWTTFSCTENYFSWFDRKNRIPFATHFSSTIFQQQQSPFYPSCCSSPYRNGASHKKPYHPILITKRSQAHFHQVYSRRSVTTYLSLSRLVQIWQRFCKGRCCRLRWGMWGERVGGGEVNALWWWWWRWRERG